ncbi:hypothetical protein T4C_11956 [Trichinella pseudospiralis]|uniref:Uncharacterized protein n=1 Tax=Trichinella pseudospiralis TaxID=6337 RepID=A0A0V1J901_TRIPS|nr:hypothetical protein T4C_11956 [Trichinella pseudospiralis]
MIPTDGKQWTAAPSRKAVEAHSFYEAVDISLFDIVSIDAPFVNYPFPSVGMSKGNILFVVDTSKVLNEGVMLCVGHVA